MMLTLDVDAVISRFGGISEMARYCTANGYPVTKQGVCRWKAARTIPMRAWIALTEIVEKDGKKLDLRKYLVRR